jgi:hypothetical protein
MYDQWYQDQLSTFTDEDSGDWIIHVIDFDLTTHGLDKKRLNDREVPSWLERTQNSPKLRFLYVSHSIFELEHECIGY